MRRLRLLFGLALAGAFVAPAAALCAPQVYHYAVTHSRYGAIGSYDRTIDQSGEVTRAQSHLKIVVRILGIVVHHETADQVEVWRGQRLVSFQCVTTVNGKPLKVSGEARDNSFLVTTPSGVATAPADVAASDPMGFSRVGHAEVVSIKSGRLDAVEVTGGETVNIPVGGTLEETRHYRVSTAAVPDKWQVWLNAQGVPVKFRSIEGNDYVEFVLTNPPVRTAAATGGLAIARVSLGPDAR
jgi:hypothetical protein